MNEFQWENEIRNDELRISCYFRELPRCLDLPGEEEIIFDRLSTQPDLARTHGSQENFRSWQDDDDDDDDFMNGYGSDESASGPVPMIDQLAVDWNVVSACAVPAEFRSEALAVSCAYGKLLARVSEFIEPGPANERPLQISLAKRSLADLNEVLGMLGFFAVEQKELLGFLASQMETLGTIREQILEFLRSLRNDETSF